MESWIIRLNLLQWIPNQKSVLHSSPHKCMSSENRCQRHYCTKLLVSQSNDLAMTASHRCRWEVRIHKTTEERTVWRVSSVVCGYARANWEATTWRQLSCAALTQTPQGEWDLTSRKLLSAELMGSSESLLLKRSVERGRGACKIAKWTGQPLMIV